MNDSDEQVKVRARYLTKRFELLNVKNSRNKAESLLGSSKNQSSFWALRNVNFEIHNGECLGIIGLNGAGKSTLSNIISGQMHQTTGDVTINGDVSIIAAVAGLQGNLTGRENIRLKGLMMGMSKKEINSKMADIIDFSELGNFIDQPVKTYSSGMKAKLGFSIMVHQDPDIMIIDEGLATGDQAFIDKAKKKMFEFHERGKTVLLVSHNMADIRSWCDKVMWLHYGEVKEIGTPLEVIPKYKEFVDWFKHQSKADQDAYKAAQRQAQLDYTVDKLEEDIAAQSVGGRLAQDDAKALGKNLVGKEKDNHKLPLSSKVIAGVCAFAFVWISLMAMSGTSFAQSLRHPGKLFNFSQSASPSPSPAATKTPTPHSSPTVSPSPTPTVLTYTVQAGDSLSEIADAHGVTLQQLRDANVPSAISPLVPGHVINLPANAMVSSSPSLSPSPHGTQSPGATTYTIQAGDTLASVASDHGVTLAALRAVNPGVDSSSMTVGQVINLPAGATR